MVVESQNLHCRESFSFAIILRMPIQQAELLSGGGKNVITSILSCRAKKATLGYHLEKHQMARR